LLRGAQYLQLASEPAPWALFARAQVPSCGLPAAIPRHDGVTLAEAVDFIGRPVQFRQSDMPLDQIHAAALSFLRHAVDSGTPISHGNTFGPADGPVFHVSHVDPTEDFPHGKFELSVAHNDADTAPRNSARFPGTPDIDAELPLPIGRPMQGIAAPHPRERTRSMVIGYLMLVIMPPVGAILLMSNAIFGPNVFRTGVVAAASVAVAVAVGTVTFVKNGQDSAQLFNGDVIQADTLAD